MRVRTTIVTIGLSLPFLTASAAGNVGESALLAAKPAVEHVAMTGRDPSALPAVAAMKLLNERVAFVARARDDVTVSLSSTSLSSVAADDPSTEPHPAMMLLSVVALMAYVIGRRGVLRG